MIFLRLFIIVIIVCCASGCFYSTQPGDVVNIPGNPSGQPSAEKNPGRTPSAGDEVGNGGGIAEKNVLFAFLNLSNNVKLFLASSQNDLVDSERELLVRIVKFLQDHPAKEIDIVFKSERKEPGTFLPDGRAHGTERSAVTGEDPAATILINRDHLYTVRTNGRSEPMDIATAGALLLDEVAHKVSARYKDSKEHALLDLLCAKFRVFLIGSEKMPAPRFSTQILFTVINPSNQEGFAKLILSDGKNMVDLSEEIGKINPCVSDKWQPTGTVITNAHWHMAGNVFMTTANSQLHIWVHAFCKPKRDDMPPALPWERITRANIIIEVSSALYDPSIGEFGDPDGLSELLFETDPAKHTVRRVNCKIDPETEEFVLTSECH